ncbi:TPA: hypothetical protein NBX34_004937 [Klebsiella aerogenes]|nr:hypothetical protein [Klebsiella aerogenes]
MTNNQLTGERLTDSDLEDLICELEAAGFYRRQLICLVELQERRKADSEPVAVREPIAWLNDAYLARGVVDGEAGSEDAGPGYIPVYREAQSAPVAPEEMPCGGAADDYHDGYQDGWNACRSAMLKAEPVTTANKLGNSPSQSPIDHGYRKGCECSGCKTTVRICAELAGNSPVIGIDPASGPDHTVEVRYVAPPGYVMVPKEPTGKQWAAGAQAFDSGMDKVTRIYKAMLAAAPQDVK